MGKEDFAFIADRSLADGALRAATGSDGHGHSLGLGGSGSPASDPGASVSGNTGETRKRGGDADPVKKAAKDAAFRSVYAASEKLRIAAIEVSAAYRTAEAVGVNRQDIIDALRLEHADWIDNFDAMQRCFELLDAVGARTELDVLIVTDVPIASAKALEAQAFSDGYLAGVVGLLPERCPFIFKTEKWTKWQAGHRKARADMVSDAG